MKICAKCKLEKPEESFYLDKRRPGGRRCYCRSCELEANRERYSKNPEKALNRYQENKYKLAPKRKEWRLANKEKLTVSKNKWRSDNLEKARAATNEWQKKNKDRRAETTRIWRDKFPDSARNAVKKWSVKNKEKLRLSWQNRRARKRYSGGKLSKGLAERLYKLQRGMCACCGYPLGDDYHLDHIMPLVLGGENADDNIQLLKSKCNLQKHSKHPIEFMQSRGFLL